MSSIHAVVKKIIMFEPQRQLLIVFYGKVLFCVSFKSGSCSLIREMNNENSDSSENATKQIV